MGKNTLLSDCINARAPLKGYKSNPKRLEGFLLEVNLKCNSMYKIT